jgi:hypothetical protein
VISRMGHHEAKYTSTERTSTEELFSAFEASVLPLPMRLQNFQRFVRRQDLSRFLAKSELFKLSLGANGSVVECGVFGGGGLFGWAQLSSIFEPYNHTRRIIGFDTFTGFPSIDEKDTDKGHSDHLHEGAFHIDDKIVAELQNMASIHDKNRPLGHIPKIELVPGDATLTIPQYVADNPHLLISLIYLDFDIYAPTKVALDHLYSRVVKGGVVAFDELNCPEFPGETLALLESLDLTRVELRRFPFDPYISYFIKE